MFCKCRMTEVQWCGDSSTYRKNDDGGKAVCRDRIIGRWWRKCHVSHQSNFGIVDIGVVHRRNGWIGSCSPGPCQEEKRGEKIQSNHLFLVLSEVSSSNFCGLSIGLLGEVASWWFLMGLASARWFSYSNESFSPIALGLKVRRKSHLVMGSRNKKMTVGNGCGLERAILWCLVFLGPL